VLCGDEEGSVWIYDVEHLLKEPPQATTLQPPTQVLLAPYRSWYPLGLLLGRQEPSAFFFPPQILKWPQPTALGQPVTKTMINTVVANAAFTYLTALTDSNIVSIWRRC
jgi:hypothetical protein